MDIHAGRGVAVREYPLKWRAGGKIKSGSADYLLHVDGRAIGVLEAKPAGHTLEGVLPQSEKYTEGLDKRVPAWKRPLPFAYESTGKVTQFTNGLDPDPRSRETFTFHRPEELLRLQGLGEAQLRAKLRRMPDLPQGRLWDVQHEAILNLERSLAHARPRALIQMADGQREDIHGGYGLPPAHQARQGRAHPVPSGPQQPWKADTKRVSAVPGSRLRLHLLRGVSGRAPERQQDQGVQQGGHHDHPASLLDSQGRSRVRPGQRRRVAVRVRRPAWRRAHPRRVHARVPHRALRLRRHRRVSPFDLQRVAAGHRVLRRLSDRSYRDAEPTDHRVLREQRRAGLLAPEGRRGRDQRRVRHLPHQYENHRGGRSGARRSRNVRAPARPANPRDNSRGA